MNVPVEIDFRRASFTLCQFEVRGNMKLCHFVKLCHFEIGLDPADEVNFSPVTGISGNRITPSQIMVRASAARGNRDWDKEAIFSCSSLLTTLSEPSFDSSLISLISRETCTESISGKLCCKNECFRITIERRSSPREGETGKHLVYDVAMCQVFENVCSCLLFKGWYIVLKPNEPRGSRT
jgi:hypothetical protein